MVLWAAAADLDWEDGQLRLATALADAGTVDDVAASVARWGAAAAGAAFANVAIFETDRNQVRVVHAPSLVTGIAERWSVFGIETQTPLCDAIVSGERVLLPDLDHVTENYPVLLDDTIASGLQATASLPLRSPDGSNMGAVGFAWEKPQQFTPQQVLRLDLIAGLTAHSLHRVTHGPPSPAVRGRGGEARVLQEALLSTILPYTEHLETAAAYLPANDAPMGGDWYDLFPVDGGSCLVIGDVAGHGLPQAALMAEIRNAIRAFADEDPSPGRVVTRVNRMVCRLHPDSTATLVVAIWDPSRQSLTRCNAGHPPVLRCRTGEFAFLPLDAAKGPMVGADQTFEYGVGVKQLRPGTTLLFYTDGLIERRNENLELGLERLLEFAKTRPSLAPRHLIDDLLLWRVSQGPLDDDVCVLAVRPGQQSFNLTL